MKNRFLLVVAFLLLSPAAGMSALRVEVTSGVSGAVPIAIVPFEGAQGLPVDIAAVIEQDLGNTGQFRILQRGEMLERPASSQLVKYENWRSVKVDNVVVGSLQGLADGGLKIRFEVLDVYKGAKLAGYEVTSRDGALALRYTAHKIADLIYEKLTGLPGYFTSRIAYVTTSGSGWKTKYELWVADYDGFNERSIARADDVIMSPSWSPDGRKLAYVAFRDGRNEIYVHELATGQATRISSRPGINGAPAWSPDGRKLAMTLSYAGSPDIYVYDLQTGQQQRITESRAIDTEPNWAPDGRSLVFTSDRGGRPQLYRVSAGGGNAERLTFEGKSNQRGVFSPDGKRLAMVHESEKGYRIAVLDLASGRLSVLSDGPLDESPGFAPNGQAIIYARATSAGAELATISVDGRVQRRLSQPGTVREPAWSPAGR
ncbi:MAG TPA: Tol-Pal system beta propeller repeat protein TolB [Nevskiales bacterium]|nr:Tol-Pal system beta propeller repeat protein TolB [Nevskiales bacterium]